MKVLKKSLFLSLSAPLLFSLMSFTIVANDVVVIRVYENGMKPRITIYEKEKVTEITLSGGSSESSKDKNLETISKTLEQYIKNGYKIETSNSAFTGSTSSMTTYILSK